MSIDDHDCFITLPCLELYFSVTDTIITISGPLRCDEDVELRQLLLRGHHRRARRACGFGSVRVCGVE